MRAWAVFAVLALVPITNIGAGEAFRGGMGIAGAGFLLPAAAGAGSMRGTLQVGTFLNDNWSLSLRFSSGSEPRQNAWLIGSELALRPFQDGPWTPVVAWRPQIQIGGRGAVFQTLVGGVHYSPVPAGFGLALEILTLERRVDRASTRHGLTLGGLQATFTF